MRMLRKNLTRQRQKFGLCFVALRAKHIEELLGRIEALETDVHCGPVAYSSDPNEQGCTCKRPEFAYQREFRFLVGECAERSTDPKVLQIGDLRDILLIDGTLELVDKDSHFKITNDGIQIS